MLIATMTAQRATPSTSGDPLAVLRIRLQRLHRHNGQPSTREISRRTDKAISHTTVSIVLRCTKNPRWGQLELVVEALGGDPREFQPLWVAVCDAADPPEMVVGAETVSDTASQMGLPLSSNQPAGIDRPLIAILRRPGLGDLYIYSEELTLQLIELPWQQDSGKSEQL